MSATAAGPSALFVGVNYAPEPTGIGPYTAGMARGLAARGWAVSAVTGHPHYPWWRVPAEHRDLPSHAVVDGVSVRRVRHFIPRRHNPLTRALHEITFGLRAAMAPWGRPDIVVLVSPALLASSIVAIRARLRGIAVIMWVQDIYTLGVREAGSGTGAGIIARLERWLANSSRRVVVIHDRFRRMFAEDLAVRSPIQVVRNWSHVPNLESRRNTGVRERYGWRDDDIVVLHAGNMGAKQGLDSVVAASRLAAEKESAVRFVLLGDGNQRAALEAMGTNANLQYIDPLDDGDFEAVVASADILLVNERPGLTEMSVPSKLTTYFATGLPVLAAVDTSSTTHEEMQAAGAGVCVSPADPAALVEAAELLASDPARAKSLGTNGQSYRERLLTESAAIEGFERVLRTALDSTPAAEPELSSARF